MADEKNEHPVKAEETSETKQETLPRRRRAESTSLGLGGITRRALRLLATLVRVVTGLAAIILVLHVVFRLANQNHALVMFVGDLADTLALGLEGLFELQGGAKWLTDPVNFGLAALVWLIAGSIVARLIRRLAIMIR